MDLKKISENFFSEKEPVKKEDPISVKTKSIKNTKVNKKKKNTNKETFTEDKQKLRDVLKDENLKAIQAFLETYNENDTEVHFGFDLFLKHYTENKEVKIIALQPEISDRSRGVKDDIYLFKPLNREEYSYFVNNIGKPKENQELFDNYVMKKCIISKEFTDDELKFMSYAEYSTLLFWLRKANKMDRTSRLLEV